MARKRCPQLIECRNWFVEFETGAASNGTRGEVGAGHIRTYRVTDTERNEVSDLKLLCVSCTFDFTLKRNWFRPEGGDDVHASVGSCFRYRLCPEHHISIRLASPSYLTGFTS